MTKEGFLLFSSFFYNQFSLKCLSSYCGRTAGTKNHSNTVQWNMLVNLLKVQNILPTKCSEEELSLKGGFAAHIFLRCTDEKKDKHSFSYFHSTNLDSGFTDCLIHSNCCCLCVLCKLCIICLKMIYKMYII